jgi:hypothetical protein
VMDCCFLAPSLLVVLSTQVAWSAGQTLSAYPGGALLTSPASALSAASCSDLDKQMAATAASTTHPRHLRTARPLLAFSAR